MGDDYGNGEHLANVTDWTFTYRWDECLFMSCMMHYMYESVRLCLFLFLQLWWVWDCWRIKWLQLCKSETVFLLVFDDCCHDWLLYCTVANLQCVMVYGLWHVACFVVMLLAVCLKHMAIWVHSKCLDCWLHKLNVILDVLINDSLIIDTDSCCKCCLHVCLFLMFW
jgi:hypothetical protein